MKKTIIAAALLLSTNALAGAGDFWLLGHLGSIHTDTDYWYSEETKVFEGINPYIYNPDNPECPHCFTTEYTVQTGHAFNERNYGLGGIYEITDHIEVRGGVFKNSFNHTSVYAGAGWHTSYDNLFSVGIVAGITSGYRDTPTGGDSPLMGFVLPNIALNIDRFKAEVGYIPPANNSEYGSDVITFSIGWRF